MFIKPNVSVKFVMEEPFYFTKHIFVICVFKLCRKRKLTKKRGDFKFLTTCTACLSPTFPSIVDVNVNKLNDASRKPLTVMTMGVLQVLRKALLSGDNRFTPPL